MIRRLTFALALTLAAANLSPAFAEDVKMPRTISLTGHGEVSVVPDRAIISLGVLQTAETADQAMKLNAKAMTDVFAALKAAGIAEKDIQTSAVSVQPRYVYADDAPPKLTGYDVSNIVTVTVRDLAKVGPILDAAVGSGSNQINGISFEVSNPQQAFDQARQLAVRDAARKAGLYTAAANLKLGPVLSISEGMAAAPVPMQTKMLGADAAPETPIAAGEQALAVDVNMVWEIE